MFIGLWEISSGWMLHSQKRANELMKLIPRAWFPRTPLALLFALALAVTISLQGAQALVFGPFNAQCQGTGPGHVGWFSGLPPSEPSDSWTLSAWVRPEGPLPQPCLVAGFGDGLNFSGAQRFFALDDKGWFFYVGENPGRLDLDNGKQPPPSADALTAEQVGMGRLETGAPLSLSHWQHLAASYDGTTLRLFVNGHQTASRAVPLARAAMQVLVAPAPPWKTGGCFKGAVARLCVWNRVLSDSELAELATQTNGLEEASFAPPPAGPTPEGRAGDYFGRRSARLPQDPSTLPGPVPQVSLKRTPKLAHPPKPQLQPNGDLVLNCGWEMADATALDAHPENIASTNFDTHGWYDATVPGTVLTTLIQQGLYPDPLHGLNNLLIPDDLARRSWWFRTQFTTPQRWDGQHIRLTFNGVNYHAEVWLNGQRLGQITGAFLRGSYDISAALVRQGNNVLAVRVWPQPHSGVAQEESPRAGMGPNGTDGVLDGPTFFCSEGWDWIPTIRDRCTGIWQDVVLHPTGAVALGDPRLVTTLPKLPGLSEAEVTVETPVRNLTAQEQQVSVVGSIAGAHFSLPVTLAPGQSTVVTAVPARFPQLRLKDPRLWWPNGYGEPTLHQLDLRVVEDSGQVSDRLTQRVGLRTITCEFKPHLKVYVNGRPIFCKGGNWGMEDALKRISRDRLEPYLRLHRDAHLTMIRNWCGQSTTETFYRLCDEYGLLVWNEFWMTTEGHDLPPIDADVMLANAEDAIPRFRDHPSIALWCGRNEGTPPPWINPRLSEALARLDGTRAYVPSSWRAPVWGGGPYVYVTPSEYFKLAIKKPFNTELGMSSVPSTDALKAMLAPSGFWPLGDAWAYHDLHAGMSDKYLEAIRSDYGEATGLEDFSRRAQMLNYVNYRAMFEAWSAQLWNPCSGVLLWMSHPAWPSVDFQLYSQDYDTHGAFFGARKGCEPIHVQWNPTDDTVAVINNLFQPLQHAVVTVRLYAMDGSCSERRQATLTVPASTAKTATQIQWPKLTGSPVQFLKLELHDRTGKLLSENFYWHAQEHQDQQALQQLAPVKLKGSVSFKRSAGQVQATIELANPTSHLALMTHLVLRDAESGRRILPVYASDNYVSLLPGEHKAIGLVCAQGDATRRMRVSLEGWNIVPAELP